MPTCFDNFAWLNAICVVACCAVGLSACDHAALPNTATPGSAPTVALANPASQHCIAQGGQHVPERGPRGEYAVCLFEDNRQCEEWALLRDTCTAGGVRITGYATAAARYCAITGGLYTVVANSGAIDERGTCTLPAAGPCDAQAHYEGACLR